MAAKDHKWFFDISPSRSVEEAAAEVLIGRVATVRQLAKRAKRKPDDIVETVHQLRVATRRMAAALRIFENCLPTQLHDRVDRANSRMRRVAGELRDLDVKVPLLRERLASATWLDHRFAESIATTVDRLHARAACRFEDQIKQRTRKYRQRAEQLKKQLSSDANVSSETGDPFGRLAQQQLGERWEELKSASSTELGDVENLHQFRIACKRLRYCLEVTASCVNGDAADEVYQTLRDLQGRLGHINDLRNLYSLLARLRPQVVGSQASKDRTPFALQYDRLTASIAFEWFELHRSLVNRWTAIGRVQLDSQVQRLWSPRGDRRDGKGRPRAIGFPISGSTVTPIISREAE